MNWKLTLDYVVASNQFLLFINDLPFLLLPFKADVTSLVPMSISRGSLKLNDVQVMKVEYGKGIYQWTSIIISLWYEQAANLHPTTEIELTDRLRCSSSNMLNTLFDVLGRTINTEHGLKKLTIFNF